MAELLIYNTTHWMDLLSTKDWESHRTANVHWEQKYLGRWQKGHVVEIRPDGFWSKDGLYPCRDVFRVLLLPGVPEKDLRHLLEPGTTERRRYQVTVGSAESLATVRTLKDLTLVDKG